MVNILTCLDKFIDSMHEFPNSPIVIYGAGEAWSGKELYQGRLGKIFKNTNFKERVSYFCDKRADQLKTILGIPVINLYDLENIKDHMLIVVCTGIDERHKDIVKNKVSDDLKKLKISADVINITDVLIYSEESGTICFDDDFIIIDFIKYMRTVPDYLNKVYRKKTISKKFINQLLDEYSMTKSWIVRSDGQYSLFDCSGEYFNIISGTRVTLPSVENYNNKIHFIGDSRIVSVFTEDQYTICSLLQEKVKNKYKVVNNGIPNRRAERMIYQLKNLDIQENDIVIFASNSNYYHELLYLYTFIEYINEAYQYCIARKVKFYYLEFPTIYDIKYKSDIQSFIMDHYYSKLNVKQMTDYKVQFLTCMLNYGINYIDITSVFEQYNFENQSENELFVDVLHYGHYGNEMIADFIYKIVNADNRIEKIQSQNEYKALKYDNEQKFKNEVFKLENLKEITDYTDELKKEYDDLVSSKLCGCIVMNCNPFTNGHKYLIETAATQVDMLFIFVLEEDKSVFCFKDRFEMVKENTKHIPNVKVLKSGRYIISSITFPEYFAKDNQKSVNIDMSNDIITFATEIAPVLNITKRFVGEEPFCAVTNEYNNQLMKILPQYGIELLVIPRVKELDEAISASSVRRNLKEGNLNIVKKLVPEYTYNLLVHKYM